jgi:hypothetical protein
MKVKTTSRVRDGAAPYRRRIEYTSLRGDGDHSADMTASIGGTLDFLAKADRHGV